MQKEEREESGEGRREESREGKREGAREGGKKRNILASYQDSKGFIYTSFLLPSHVDCLSCERLSTKAKVFEECGGASSFFYIV